MVRITTHYTLNTQPLCNDTKREFKRMTTDTNKVTCPDCRKLLEGMYTAKVNDWLGMELGGNV